MVNATWVCAFHHTPLQTLQLQRVRTYAAEVRNRPDTYTFFSASSVTPIIIGAVVGGVGAIFGLVMIVCMIRKNRKNKNSPPELSYPTVTKQPSSSSIMPKVFLPYHTYEVPG